LEIQSVSIDDQFFHHYQPIYDIQRWEVFGYESLFRTGNSSSPEEAFNNAKIKKMLYELDSRSIHKASLSYAQAGYLTKYNHLFLNVFPSTLTNPLFPTFVNKIINENGFSCQQIILEINEGEIAELDIIKNVIIYLKNLGIAIAIDDFGKGNSSIKSLIELSPDFVKLDRYFMDDLTEKKLDMIQYLLHFCKKHNSNLIIEGIEEKASLALLKSIGVQYAQGYLLGRPSILT
jgi:EAL domain-containing protein (putative c-di-GMP-specific phosphodiesterase class I)